ncbi:flagellar motor switch protein FliN/FliY [Evansella vedderi]|uniref:Flagellar motor switch protein FliN/FliY n=1 Tax=Evansella vedderi TaxID=38282 RepID=A0ABT9ZT96_9BACI|nr:flagellar motor switch phosphatase FliY [Evansella vedderi]MDQ0253703.1 flagellar motor switch protein FliN/FliY [Evansella vedderi]
MSDEMLSQEEINALLMGMSSDNEDENKTEDLDIGNYLSGIEEDALGEIGNISFGSAATALSTLLNQKVDITTPHVSVIHKNKLSEIFPKPHVAVSVNYTAGFEGMNLLVIKTTDAAIIADLMFGNDGSNAGEDLGEMELSAVQEAMNQMMGSASTSMSTIFNKRVDISPPNIDLLNLKENPDHADIPEDDVLVQISFDIKVGNLIDSKLMQLVTVSFAKNMVEQLMNPDYELPETASEANTAEVKHSEGGYTEQVHSNDLNHRMERDLYSPERKELQQAPKLDRSAKVQPVAFSNFEAPSLGETEAKNLNMLLDIPLDVTVELGRTKRSIKDILELTQGSIIELDKLAGEPVDILVNQRLIAKGEVVVIDENFGVRLTDIVSQRERIQNLK